MSREYSSDSFFGVYITMADLEALTVGRAERSHLEQRFDPKTGKRLKDEKVIDEEAEQVLIFREKVYESGNEEEYLDVVAKELGLDYIIHGGGYDEVHGYVVGIPLDDKSGADTIKAIKAVHKKVKKINKMFCIANRMALVHSILNCY